MDEHQAAVRGEPLAVLLRLRVAIAGQHDLRAERLDRVDLDLRGRPRHDDDGAQAEALRREGDALRVIAGAGGDDAARAILRRQPGDPVVGAADLEAEDRLEVFALEQHLVVEPPRQARRQIERRFPGHFVHTAGQNLAQERVHVGVYYIRPVSFTTLQKLRTTAPRNAADLSAFLIEQMRRERLVLRSGTMPSSSAYRAVNTVMVRVYWHVGRLIVEHEQGGRKRAAYGETMLDDLSRRLTTDFGKGFTTTNLKYMRSFYVAFPIRHALRDESRATPVERLPACLRPELSWTHYRLLLGVEDPIARDWYMRESADQQWSTRQLERQISALYYERLLASRQKIPVRKEAAAKLALAEPQEFIRDPYVLEFLNLEEYPALRESTVEQGIIDNLQAFLLELGKCFMLVDLKVGKLTHQDIGQMESYVRLFDAQARSEGDNPTIGLILCSRKNEAIAKYSVLGEALSFQLAHVDLVGADRLDVARRPAPRLVERVRRRR